MYCGCRNEYGAPPNTHTCPVCLGMPGALPVPNEFALETAALTGLMLNCDIAPISKFDRKHYFYPDMPKNYQITQYDLPICLNGYVDLVKECYPKDAQKSISETKRVRLVRIHQEEDVAKSFHFGDNTGIDFNRAGSPLMEIVTEPDMTTPEEAFAFLSTLRQILLYGDVSYADMEKGQMRCDCNVSIRPVGTEKFGTKIEIKNMNSISGVRRALAYEIKRQEELLDKGEILRQETRRWDDTKGVTSLMRTKEMAHDYRYFPEPDMVPIKSEAFLSRSQARLPELPSQKKSRFISDFAVSENNASVLVADVALAHYFEKAAALTKNANAAANFIVNDLMRDLSNAGLGIENSPVTPEMIVELVALADKGTINSKQAKDLLVEMFTSQKTAQELVAAQPEKYAPVDSGLIDKICDEVIAANPASVADYKSGKISAINFLKGQVMKQSKGKANPNQVDELLKAKLV